MNALANSDSVLIRRATAALVALVAAISVAACGSSGAASPGPAHASSTTTTASGKKATTQICQEVATEMTSFAAPLLPLLQGNPTGAQLQTDIAQAQAGVTSLAQSLQTEAASAQDPAIAGDLNNAASQMTSTVATALDGDQNTMALQTAILQLETAVSGLYNDCPQLPKLTP
jgi:hypothetical protein